jgi:hypothetical protein
VDPRVGLDAVEKRKSCPSWINIVQHVNNYEQETWKADEIQEDTIQLSLRGSLSGGETDMDNTETHPSAVKLNEHKKKYVAWKIQGYVVNRYCSNVIYLNSLGLTLLAYTVKAYC